MKELLYFEGDVRAMESLPTIVALLHRNRRRLDTWVGFNARQESHSCLLEKAHGEVTWESIPFTQSENGLIYWELVLSEVNLHE